MGILGILVISKDKGFIPSVKPFIEELNSQGFRLSEKVAWLLQLQSCHAIREW